jgi:hypothetical protein
MVREGRTEAAKDAEGKPLLDDADDEVAIEDVSDCDVDVMVAVIPGELSCRRYIGGAAIALDARERAMTDDTRADFLVLRI